MEESKPHVPSALKCINESIQEALKESKFNQKVRLVAASKFKTPEHLMEAYNCGVRDFGENYVDEMVEKSAKLPKDIRWHFIGHLQSNKCKKVVIPNLEYLETIDSVKIAEKVNKVVEAAQRDKLKVFVQIRTSDEDTKSGVEPERCFELIEYIRNHCPNLIFCGLMTIGGTGDFGAFKVMSDLKAKVCEKFNMDFNSVELSMGMSADFLEAVKSGSTNVRVGTLIFGERPKKVTEEKADTEEAEDPSKETKEEPRSLSDNK